MKYCLPVLILFLYANQCMAQDTIYKRNEEKIIAKILEVNPTEIKYKRFDYQDGPVFNAGKWEIKYIVYANGVKENCEKFSAPLTQLVFKNNLLIQPAGRFYYYQDMKITEPDMLDIVKKANDKRINAMAKKTQDDKLIHKTFLYGGIVIGTAGFLEVVGILPAFGPKPSSVGANSRASRKAVTTQRQHTAEDLALVAIGCELVSVTFKIEEMHHAHLAVSTFNRLHAD